MYTPNLPHLETGTINLCQLYDLGDKIILASVSKCISKPIAFLQLSVSVRQWESISITQPPLQVELETHNISLFGLELRGVLKANIYNLGAVALTLQFPLPSATPWEIIAQLMGAIQSPSESLQAIFSEAISYLERVIYSAIINPSRSTIVEDYSILVIEKFQEKIAVSTLTDNPQLWEILLGEKQSLSAYISKMLTSISYYQDDLALLSWNGAILIEPDPLAAETALELIEFSNVELLLMRSYDEALDQELPKLYRQLPKKRPRFAIPLVRRYSSLLHDVQRLIVEFTEVTERVDNALKVTDDVYWNRFYSAILNVLKVDVWRSGVDHKLAILRQTYSMLHNDADAERATALEWIIVFLILFEIVTALVRH